MDDLHFPTYEDISTQTEEFLIKKEEPEVDIAGNQAFCLVVSRPGADGSTRIKPFVVPNSFFVIPDRASATEKAKVQNKIDKIAASYTLNQYTVQKQKFTVPFTVDVIPGVSKGYIVTSAKRLAIEDVQIAPVVADTAKKGRKRAVDDDEPRAKRGRKE
jgi:hypothetical protein